MNLRNRLRGLMITAGMVWAGQSQAVSPVIYASSNLLRNQVGYLCSTCAGSAFEPLDQFSLAKGYVVDGFNLWTYVDPRHGFDGGLSGVTLEIYNADHSRLIFSESLHPTLVFAGSRNRMAYDVVYGALSGLRLKAGAYWVGFYAPNLGVAYGPGGNFSLIDTTPHTGVETSVVGGDTFYQLTGKLAVPESTSWVLMSVGLAIGGAALRLRRRGAAASDRKAGAW